MQSFGSGFFLGKIRVRGSLSVLLKAFWFLFTLLMSDVPLIYQIHKPAPDPVKFEPDPDP